MEPKKTISVLVIVAIACVVSAVVVAYVIRDLRAARQAEARPTVPTANNSPPGAPTRTELRVLMPCCMVRSLGWIKDDFEKQFPAVDVRLDFDIPEKPRVLQEIGDNPPDACLTLGPLEMDALVKGGIVNSRAPVPVARWRIGLGAPVARPDLVSGLEALARPEVTRIAITDPAVSSLGWQAQNMLQKAGLWEKVKDKMVYQPRPLACYMAIPRGKADVCFGYLGCAFTMDASKKAFAKVALAKLLDENAGAPAYVMAAMCKTARHQKEAQDFVRFLTTPEAQGMFGRLGIGPVVEGKQRAEIGIGGTKVDEKKEARTLK